MKKLTFLLIILLAACGSGGEDESVRIYETPENIPQTEANLINLNGVEVQMYPDFKVCGQYRISISHGKQFEVEIEQRQALDKAIATWNKFMQQDVFVSVETDVCVARDIAATIVPDSAGLMNATNYYMFREQGTGVGDCTCIINADYDSAFYWNLWAHELGHCLGLGHASSEKSIMYKNAKSYDFTTEMIDIVSKSQDINRLGPELPESFTDKYCR